MCVDVLIQKVIAVKCKNQLFVFQQPFAERSVPNRVSEVVAGDVSLIQCIVDIAFNFKLFGQLQG